MLGYKVRIKQVDFGIYLYVSIFWSNRDCVIFNTMKTWVPSYLMRHWLLIKPQLDGKLQQQPYDVSRDWTLAIQVFYQLRKTRGPGKIVHGAVMISEERRVVYRCCRYW